MTLGQNRTRATLVREVSALTTVPSMFHNLFANYSIHCDKLRGLALMTSEMSRPIMALGNVELVQGESVLIASQLISLLNRITLSTLISLSRSVLERKTSFRLLRKTNGPKTRGCLLKTMNKINESNKHF